MATLREYIEVERAKKEMKARKKAERKEVERRAMEEKEARERKAEKKAEKAREEEERVAAIRKDMDLHVKLTVKEALSGAYAEFREAIAAAKLHEKMKGKQNDIEEIRERMQGLSINEKRKRGPKPVFEDNPPMELPAKRTPKRTPKRGIQKPAKLTPRLTRSKTKTKVRLSPATKERITAVAKRKIPASMGKIGRYKLMEDVMRLPKDYDAITLQNICLEEGVQYRGKIDAIFDLAEHRAYIAYGTDNEDDGEVESKQDIDEVGATKIVEGNEGVAEDVDE
ncbi:hypothetical protein CBR_g54043 [Chara braunii]|uniref:Uncharacterized protein n=1 Tax=Chara braunii TaxID=69332 RepID=A0A388MBK3_CHABU|nr:hypothetical protein CBR_g54043 [Chara braunii]|eukprot:GBG91947.1 hypothetical protein CBR_g54043 [Chara braunii]